MRNSILPVHVIVLPFYRLVFSWCPRRLYCHHSLKLPIFCVSRCNSINSLLSNLTRRQIHCVLSCPSVLLLSLLPGIFFAVYLPVAFYFFIRGSAHKHHFLGETRVQTQDSILSWEGSIQLGFQKRWESPRLQYSLR